MRNYFRAITTILFGVAVCLFWGLGYPEALNYQEQNQLWLTTGDYFRERMTVPGGLADYVSEFLVQFYYVPWLGALLIGVVYAAMADVDDGEEMGQDGIPYHILAATADVMASRRH